MFCVYDNNRPAKYPECAVHSSWNNNKFNTYQEAIGYVCNWLGEYAPEYLSELELNVPYHYAGSNDTVEIREE